MGYLSSGKVKARPAHPTRRSRPSPTSPPDAPFPPPPARRPQVIFIDTFHLFPETHQFLHRLEAAFGFKAQTFHCADAATKAEYDAKHGADLWQRDIDQYDKLCKVEPFSRALKTLAVDAMINGRRRDHGFERAHLEARFLGLFGAGRPPQPRGRRPRMQPADAPTSPHASRVWRLTRRPPLGNPPPQVWEDKGGASVSVQPLAYWEFRDCFAYLDKHGVEAHPLHAKGYPSIGDVHSTAPVPREKWFEYAGERSGRFQGLTDKDGKPKTECGIHVDGSTRKYDRDLWEAGSGVEELTVAQFQAGALRGKDAVVAVYAPWCPFCQKMEAEFIKFAKGVKGQGVAVYKLRGDTEREYVRANLDVASFPTVLAFPKSGAGEGGKAFAKYGSEERAAEDFVKFANGALKAQLLKLK